MESARRRAGKPGPEPLTAQRQEFVRLIARGLNNSEACRVVGINRRTGTRWRHGRTITSSSGSELHYQPVTTTDRPGLSARSLSEDEWIGHPMGLSHIGIANSSSAISGISEYIATTQCSRPPHRSARASASCCGQYSCTRCRPRISNGTTKNRSKTWVWWCEFCGQRQGAQGLICRGGPGRLPL